MKKKEEKEKRKRRRYYRRTQTQHTYKISNSSIFRMQLQEHREHEQCLSYCYTITNNNLDDNTASTKVTTIVDVHAATAKHEDL